jgi:CxxC-x17-CxxC domain-containing protein
LPWVCESIKSIKRIWIRKENSIYARGIGLNTQACSIKTDSLLLGGHSAFRCCFSNWIIRKISKKGERMSFGDDEESEDKPEREMFDAVCSKCGKPCQVPFKPTEGRPVYCRDCFRPRKRF